MFGRFRRLLAVLSGLNSTKMVREFDMVGDYDLEPVRSVYDYSLEALLHVPNINDVVERELTSVGREIYQMVVPRLVASIFFTDSSSGGAGTGFGVYHSVISPVFVLGYQVECLLRRCRRFLWL
jgi:hypothetical protein